EAGLVTAAQEQDIKQSLESIVNHDELKVFFAEGVTVFNEQNIIRRNIQNIKPDRVAVKENKAWLLDYKTGAHQPKYEKQLAEYEMALQEMGFEVAKKALVYIGETINVVHLSQN